MKIRTTATNRRIRSAGTIMIAFAALTAACGGDAEVLESAVAAETESAEATSAASENEAPAADQSNSVPQDSSGQSSTDQSSTDQSSSNESTGATPAPAATPEQPAEEQPLQSQDQPEQADEQPADDEPVAEEPAVDEPAAEEPAAEEPAADEPAADEPVAEEPAAEEPAEAVRQLLVGIEYTSSFGPINVEAELTGFVGDRYKGIESVCLVQYNEYGNPVYTGNSRAYTSLAGFVEIDGVRYPDLIANGCRPYDDNFGEYTRDWSVEATRGINGNRKDYFDIAIRGEDGQVRVFCMNTSNVAAGFVERNMADFAGRSSIGRCPA